MRLPLLLISSVATLAACTATVRDTTPTRIAAIEVPAIAHPQGETASWWYRSGAARAAANGAMGGRAKNVIVFLGDGMSLTTVAAARILDGQRKGQPGEENQLAWEAFPATALSKTYNTDSQTPDSAGTMSAIATGVKTFMGSIAVGPASRSDDCAGSLHNRNLTWLELAQSAGMATGIVSTARLTHATPASTYAHVPTRGWESDADLPAEAVRAGCHDIARQLVETPFGGPVVALGGGLGGFVADTIADPAAPSRHGKRKDGRNLVAEWLAAHPKGAFVRDTQQLRAAAEAPRLFGLFAGSHMDFDHDRDTSPKGQPSLAEMTRAAIHTLSRDPDGYVLLVEGARIDMANHYGNAFRALDDTIAMSHAVQAAIEATSADDTLILVTADHSHSLNFVGYPVRGNPILGKVRGKSSFDGTPGELARDGTGLPYTTLGYANGPGYTGASDSQPAGSKRFPHMGKGYLPATGRPDLTEVDTTRPDYMQEAIVPLSSESHGGEDVGIWARGPGSDAVRGTVEQNVIYHIIVQATPTLRERLCAAGTCNGDGVPVELPSIDAFVPATH
ncbi:alkaline phosphatase [Luteimonas notoginsengisoli]|uniref:Alkaline phosphatase n=1 Tax=Luteimonas notoginsengisoli TaxID=1578200 RepID=A0ABV7UXV9_9GAMM